MKDFRTSLYSRYVSGFKTGSEVSMGLSPRIEDYHHRNFLPHLKGLPVDSPVLELGCGSGQFLATLKKQAFTEVEGIDVSAEQVQLAQEHDLPARCVDVFEFLESCSRQYKVVIAIDFFEHFNKPELLRLGKLIAAVMEGDGLLLLQTPNGKSPFALRNIYGDFTHMTIFSDESIRQWLGPAGFSSVFLFSPVPGTIVWRDSVRAFLRRIILSLLKFKTFLVTGRIEANLGENIIAVAKRDPVVREG